MKIFRDVQKRRKTFLALNQIELKKSNSENFLSNSQRNNKKKIALKRTPLNSLDTLENV